jgi:hypothetical protein
MRKGFRQTTTLEQTLRFAHEEGGLRLILHYDRMVVYVYSDMEVGLRTTDLSYSPEGLFIDEYGL